MSLYFSACHEYVRMQCLSVMISCQWSFPEIEHMFGKISEFFEFGELLKHDLVSILICHAEIVLTY